MNPRRLSRSLMLTALAAAALSLAACTSSATPDASRSASPTAIGGDIVAPVTMAANDLQGTSVDLVVGQVLNVTTGDLAPDSYTGEVADTDIATFTPGGEKSGAVFNPGVTAVAPGTTEVTMTNAQGGIQPLTFTVVVTAKP